MRLEDAFQDPALYGAYSAFERLCDDYLRQLISEDRKSRRGWELNAETALEVAFDAECQRVERKDTEHVRNDAMALLAAARRLAVFSDDAPSVRTISRRPTSETRSTRTRRRYTQTRLRRCRR
jgi:hypothetical protein